MSGLPPRGPELPDEERELSSSAYEASVPGRMGGFRGTNPIAFLIAGVLAIGIVLFAGIAFFHRSPPPDPQKLAQTRAQENAQPAAPGIGGAVQTPFIPEGTPLPLPRRTPVQLIPLPTREPETAPPVTQVPVTEEPMPVERQQPVPVVPAPAEAQQPPSNDEMKIAQPSSAPAGATGATASGSSGSSGTHYVPVYRDGQLVSVVEVQNSPTPAAAPSATAAPAQSAQFVGDGDARSQTALGSGNAGLIEARKFARDQADAKVGYVRPSTRRQLSTASVLNARLLSKIESDLPGPVLAQITQPVYDTNTHTVVVVPAGTRVFGRYDEETVNSSTRVLMAFNRLVFPDGEEFDIGGQPGSDSQGAAGLTGDVDQHRGTLYTSALLLTVLGGAEAAITPQTNGFSNVPSVTQQAQSAAGAQLDQLGNKLLDRAVDRPSTIIVRPPYAFEIIVTRDLPLDAYAAQHQ